MKRRDFFKAISGGILGSLAALFLPSSEKQGQRSKKICDISEGDWRTITIWTSVSLDSNCCTISAWTVGQDGESRLQVKTIPTAND